MSHQENPLDSYTKMPIILTDKLFRTDGVNANFVRKAYCLMGKNSQTPHCLRLLSETANRRIDLTNPEAPHTEEERYDQHFPMVQIHWTTLAQKLKKRGHDLNDIYIIGIIKETARHDKNGRPHTPYPTCTFHTRKDNDPSLSIQQIHERTILDRFSRRPDGEIMELARKDWVKASKHFYMMDVVASSVKDLKYLNTKGRVVEEYNSGKRHYKINGKNFNPFYSTVSYLYGTSEEVAEFFSNLSVSQVDGREKTMGYLALPLVSMLDSLKVNNFTERREEQKEDPNFDIHLEKMNQFYGHW